jgi:hypothetical protein
MLGKILEAEQKLLPGFNNPLNIIRHVVNRATCPNPEALPDVAKVYAKMSQEAYQEPDKRSDSIGGFELLKDHSNELVAVYFLEDKDLYVLAIKGTDTLKELVVDDLLLAMGIELKDSPPRLNQWTVEKGFFRLLEEKGGESKVHVTGHSLGGNIAMNMALTFNKLITAGHVFNAGAPIDEWFTLPFSRDIGRIGRWMRGKELSSDNFWHHHIVGDPLSGIFDKAKFQVNYNGYITNPHTVDNFSDEYDKSWPFELKNFSESTPFEAI